MGRAVSAGPPGATASIRTAPPPPCARKRRSKLAAQCWSKLAAQYWSKMAAQYWSKLAAQCWSNVVCRSRNAGQMPRPGPRRRGRRARCNAGRKWLSKYWSKRHSKYWSKCHSKYWSKCHSKQWSKCHSKTGQDAIQNTGQNARWPHQRAHGQGHGLLRRTRGATASFDQFDATTLFVVFDPFCTGSIGLYFEQH